MRFLALLAFLSASLFGFTQNISWNHSENYLTIPTSDVTGFSAVIATGKIEFIPVNVEGKLFYLPQIDGYSNSLEVGNPNLPTINRLFEIPLGAKVEVEVVNIDIQYVDLKEIGINAPIIPAQAPAVKSDLVKRDFAYNKLVYMMNKYYKNDLMKTEVLGIYRDVNLARFIFSPIEYNPVTNKMKVVTRVRIKVKFVGGDLEATKILKQRMYSPQFQLTQDLLVNKNTFKISQQDSVQFPMKYVIIADTVFRSTLQPFINWKNQQGYKVIEAWEQNPSVGTGQASKKNYLQSLYNNATTNDPAPTYVLFVGDVGEITPFGGVASSSHITDLYYCEFTNDEFPEYFYGRFSVENNLELSNIIEKTLEYEKLLIPSTNYLDTSVLIAGADGYYGPTHGNGQINYGTSTYYNLAHGIKVKAYLHPASAFASQIRADANRGAAFINYTAHGSPSGWADPSFLNSHVAQMTNYQKYPVMIGNACLTGKFDESDCFGEVLTNSLKKGAVGYIGASNNTYWDEDYYWAVGYKAVTTMPAYSASARGIYDGIFHDHGEAFNKWAISLGQISQCGNMAVTQSGSSSLYYWEVYHVFGDPSLIHYSIKPSPITAVYNPSIFLGTTSFVVQTEPHALVGLSLNDTLLSSAMADSTGQASLYLGNLSQLGKAIMYITAQNKEPFKDTISISIANGPFLLPFDITISDQNGNNNGKADNNETVNISMKIRNIANFATGGVIARVSCNSQSIIFTDSIENIGSFAGLDTIDLINSFTFNVANNAIDKQSVSFNIQIIDSANNIWNSVTTTKTYAPILQLMYITVDDTQGNGNGNIDPGEVVTAKIYFSNTGSNKATSLNGVLISNSPSVSVLNNYSKDSISASDTLFASFQIQIANSAAIGSIHDLHFDLSNSYSNLSGDYSIVIGQIDEDFETGNLTKFSWTGNTNLWIIDSITQAVYAGDYSLRSFYIGDEDSSSLMIELNVLQPDSISFYKRVSSEESYDYLSFYIDGVLIKHWSGYGSWSRVAFPINPGYHKLKWSYEKDYNTISGEDAAWIDDIVFPPCDLLSGIEHVGADEFIFNIYPNPASDRVQVEYTLDHGASIYYMLVDVNGRMVLTSPKKMKSAGKHIETINTARLQNGIYTIMIYNNGMINSSKVLITK